jgi:hypothetical protein
LAFRASLCILPVFDVYSQPLWGKEPEPLKCLWI